MIRKVVKIFLKIFTALLRGMSNDKRTAHYRPECHSEQEFLDTKTPFLELRFFSKWPFTVLWMAVLICPRISARLEVAQLMHSQIPHAIWAQFPGDCVVCTVLGCSLANPGTTEIWPVDRRGG